MSGTRLWAFPIKGPGRCQLAIPGNAAFTNFIEDAVASATSRDQMESMAYILATRTCTFVEREHWGTLADCLRRFEARHLPLFPARISHLSAIASALEDFSRRLPSFLVFVAFEHGDEFTHANLAVPRVFDYTLDAGYAKAKLLFHDLFPHVAPITIGSDAPIYIDDLGMPVTKATVEASLADALADRIVRSRAEVRAHLRQIAFSGPAWDKFRNQVAEAILKLERDHGWTGSR